MPVPRLSWNAAASQQAAAAAAGDCCAAAASTATHAIRQDVTQELA
jgi:hypothetical protein